MGNTGQGKRIINNLSKLCAILNHETVTGSKFFAEYIYNAFALKYWRITVFFLWFLQYNCLFTMGAPGIVVARRGGLRAQRAMSGQRNHEKPVCGFNLGPKKKKKKTSVACR